MNAEKRAHARYPFRLPAQLRGGGLEVAAITRDLSLGGLFLETSARLEYGTRCEVRLRLPAGPEMSVLECVVRWNVSDGLGLAFERLQPLDTWAINQVVALFQR